MAGSITYSASGSVCFDGDGVEVYQAVTLAAALDLNRRTGLVPVRGWSKRRALDTAARITGKKYKLVDMEQAATDLRAWAEDAKATLTIHVEGQS